MIRDLFFRLGLADTYRPPTAVALYLSYGLLAFSPARA